MGTLVLPILRISYIDGSVYFQWHSDQKLYNVYIFLYKAFSLDFRYPVHRHWLGLLIWSNHVKQDFKNSLHIWIFYKSCFNISRPPHIYCLQSVFRRNWTVREYWQYLFQDIQKCEFNWFNSTLYQTVVLLLQLSYLVLTMETSYYFPDLEQCRNFRILVMLPIVYSQQEL